MPEKRRAVLLKVVPTAMVVEMRQGFDVRGVVGWLPVYDNAERARKDAKGDDDAVIELE